MDSKTSSLLAELNRAFYIRFAGDFARTRRAWPPGFDLILPYISAAANLLDLGCGNARLLDFLGDRGWQGSYLGIDGSRELLAIAEESARQAPPGILTRFLWADLLDAGWMDRVKAASAPDQRFACDVMTCLAVLHHVPGSAERSHFVRNCAGLLAPGGLLVLSTWQFMSSPRLRRRLLPWSTVGLSEADVEPGDYLVAWGEGASGHRYCASIDREALVGLAEDNGLETVATIYADGHEGNLNLYGIFRRPVSL
jgi:2-polyprenyl-3-methyl-5-hydroxy-6-metoxy-1,4-benzoquinol methylase